MSLTAEEVDRFTVVKLKEELSKRGLPVSGVKAVLTDRLKEAVASEEAAPAITDGTAEVAASKPPQTTAEEPEAAPAAENGAAAAGGKTAIEFKEPVALGEEGSKSLDDKKKARAARFGMPVATTDAEKLRARADRFGASASAETGKKAPLDATVTMEDMEKKKARAKRFGITPIFSKDEEQLKKKIRAERFGAEAVGGGSGDLAAKLAARKERFDAPAPGSSASDFEEKKKARAIRFAASGGS